MDKNTKENKKTLAQENNDYLEQEEKNLTIDDIENGIVKNVKFQGGCHGNLQGIAALCEGKSAEEIIEAVSGIRCGFKSTSCPDQLAKALAKALESEVK